MLDTTKSKTMLEMEDSERLWQLFDNFGFQEFIDQGSAVKEDPRFAEIEAKFQREQEKGDLTIDEIKQMHGELLAILGSAITHKEKDEIVADTDRADPAAVAADTNHDGKLSKEEFEKYEQIKAEIEFTETMQFVSKTMGSADIPALTPATDLQLAAPLLDSLRSF